jgi:hypothetical protein
MTYDSWSLVCEVERGEEHDMILFGIPKVVELEIWAGR